MKLFEAHKKKDPKYWKPMDFFGFYLEERKQLTGNTGNLWIDMNELTQTLSGLRRETQGDNKSAKMRSYISYALTQLSKHGKDIDFRNLFHGEDARKLKNNFLLKEKGCD